MKILSLWTIKIPGFLLTGMPLSGWISSENPSNLFRNSNWGIFPGQRSHIHILRSSAVIRSHVTTTIGQTMDQESWS